MRNKSLWLVTVMAIFLLSSQAVHAQDGDGTKEKRSNPKGQDKKGTKVEKERKAKHAADSIRQEAEETDTLKRRGEDNGIAKDKKDKEGKSKGNAYGKSKEKKSGKDFGKQRSEDAKQKEKTTNKKTIDNQ